VKLFICVPTSHFAKQAVFYDHFYIMDKPVDTVTVSPHGQSPAAGRNMAIKLALDNDATHVLFIDDDTIVPKDLFTKLVAHDVDMVSGVYCMRNSPHKPILFDEANDKGHCLHYNVEDGKGEGLVEIVAAGLGACLIKTEVFKRMEPPWITLGELDPENWCDDISFFKRARAAGFKLFADLSVRSGHMATVIITPEYIDGKWHVKYDTEGTQHFLSPMPRSPKMELTHA